MLTFPVEMCARERERERESIVIILRFREFITNFALSSIAMDIQLSIKVSFFKFPFRLDETSKTTNSEP